MLGVLIQGRTAGDAVAQIAEAERAGVAAAWGTMGIAGGADPLATLAAAAARTERIRLGTAIVHTWPRHPVVFAQEALAIDQIAPGRLRLGIGPTAAPAVERTYGMMYSKPLTQVREYVTTLRALLHEGEATIDGTHVRTTARLAQTADVAVMASALRPRAFELCGEVADGAISWLAPRSYLVEHALSAVAAGAARANRDAPPIVAHVPVAITGDRAAARALARDQFAFFLRAPAYVAMFATAGHDTASGFTDALLDDLVVSGSAQEVVEGLRACLEAGMGEVIAHPLLDPADRDGSITRVFEAVGSAAG